MTVDQSLSAGRMMIELSSRSECRAFFCSAGKLFFGSFAFCRIKLVFARIFSTSSLSGRVLMAVSTFAIMSAVGIVCGVMKSIMFSVGGC